MFGLDACPSEAQPCGIGCPAHCHDGECCLGALAVAALGEVHAHPVEVFSKDSIVPKFSCTAMPDSRKAAETAVDTSSSSLGRMRGPVWKSWIRDPNVLKIEATCTPVAPAPTTSIDGGTEVKRHASLWVLVNSEPGTWSFRLTPPVQMMIFSA